jgi:hypothetical protein
VVTNQCIRLIQALVGFSQIRPIDEVLKTTVGIISVLGNVRSGISNYLNLRQPYLLLDYFKSKTLPKSYDTDLENFWTQKSLTFFIIYSRKPAFSFEGVPVR